MGAALLAAGERPAEILDDGWTIDTRTNVFSGYRLISFNRGFVEKEPITVQLAPDWDN